MALREHRIDRLTLDDLRPAHQTAEGYVFADLRIAKPGVLVYTRADGTSFRELVPESTLADPEWLASIARKPLTIEHPPTMVGPDNIARYGKGLMGSHARYAGGFVTVDTTVTHRDALDAIKAGKVEISPGYDVELDPTPGVHSEFGRYDAIQVKRLCNHIAITDGARGGPEILGRFDSTDGLSVAIQLPPPLAAPSPVPEVQMDPTLIAVAALLGVRRDGFKTDDEFKSAATAAAGAAASAATQARTDSAATQARLDGEIASLKTERDTLKTERDTLSGEKQALQGRVDAFESSEKQRKDAAEKARLETLAKATNTDIQGLEPKAARLKLAQSRVDALDDKTPDAVVEGVLQVIEKDAARADGSGEDHRYDGWNQNGGSGGGGGERRDNQGGGNGGERRDPFWNPFTSASDEAFYGGHKQ